ncbi:hypothetical protein E2C01_037201 [Portunus trituberculatus]|uniref:Uncharacterized protein n=1 Tax=Portunus trituberculatus TaxID=210409 RepID=A0A5B7F8Q8_PORTR|nr:hypothetical protein [Portunus trituberculatus]
MVTVRQLYIAPVHSSCTGTRFYHEFWKGSDDFIDIRKGLWRSED